MFPNMEKLTAAILKNLDIVHLGSPLFVHAILDSKRPVKPTKTFPIHIQIACTIVDGWITPGIILTSPNITCTEADTYDNFSLDFISMCFSLKYYHRAQISVCHCLKNYIKRY